MKKQIFHTPDLFKIEAKEKELILKGYKLIEERRETHNLKPLEYFKFVHDSEPEIAFELIWLE